MLVDSMPHLQVSPKTPNLDSLTLLFQFLSTGFDSLLNSWSAYCVWLLCLTEFYLLDCGFDVHKKYVHKVEELCVGPTTPSTSSSSASAGAKKADKKGLFGIGRILSERDLPSNRKPSVPQGMNFTTSYSREWWKKIVWLKISQLLKSQQFLVNLYETWLKWLTHELIKLLEYQLD